MAESNPLCKFGYCPHPLYHNEEWCIFHLPKLTAEQIEKLTQLDREGYAKLEDEFRKKIYQFQADALDINVSKSWDHVNVLRGAAEQLAELLRLPETLAVLRQNRDDDEIEGRE